MPLFIFPMNIAHTQTAFLRITFRQDAVLQITFQKKILCRAQNRLPLGRCNKIATPSNKIPHTAHQGRGHLEGVLQECWEGRYFAGTVAVEERAVERRAVKERWKGKRRKEDQQGNQPLNLPAFNNENDKVKAPVRLVRQFLPNPESSGLNSL